MLGSLINNLLINRDTLSFSRKIVGFSTARIQTSGTTEVWTNGYQLSLLDEKFQLANSVHKPFTLWLGMKAVSCPKQVPLYCQVFLWWCKKSFENLLTQLNLSTHYTGNYHPLKVSLSDEFCNCFHKRHLLYLYVQSCSSDWQMLFYSIPTTLQRLHWPVNKCKEYFKVKPAVIEIKLPRTCPSLVSTVLIRSVLFEWVSTIGWDSMLVSAEENALLVTV